MNAETVLRELVSCKSPSSEEEAACKLLANHLDLAGYDTWLDEIGNLHAVFGNGPREIMMLGHIDTVAGFPEVRDEDGRLYGRGAVDAKGPLVSFAAAGYGMDIPVDWKLHIVGAVGEEADSRGAQFLSKNAEQPEMVIIGEPSSWNRVVLGYKGCANLHYTIKSEIAHSAGNSTTACEEAIKFWQMLTAWTESWNHPRKKIFDMLLVSLREMNSQDDGLQQTAELKINFRLPPELNGKQLEKVIEEIKQENAECVFSDSLPAYRSEKNSPLVRSLIHAVRTNGGKPGYVMKTGTADMNVVGQVWDCPMAAYGPGDSSLDHTPGEFIEWEEFHKGIAVLKTALSSLMV